MAVTMIVLGNYLKCGKYRQLLSRLGFFVFIRPYSLGFGPMP